MMGRVIGKPVRDGPGAFLKPERKEAVAPREEVPFGLSGIDLYEADFDALEAARTNVRAVEGVEIGFYWRDLLRENTERRYDAIVMNPPFHRARAADIGLGAGMIRAAAAALEPGGLLYMVANRQLPYEAVLADVFAQSAEIASGEGFKVIRARR